MKRELLIAAGVAIAIASAGARAQIYKCTSKDGRIAFQDSPCVGATGSTVDLKPLNSGVVVVNPKTQQPANPTAAKAAPPAREPEPPAPPKPVTQAERDAAQLKSMENERKRRAIDYEMNDAVSLLESLKLKMEQELAGLRARKDSMTSSVPGSVLEAGAIADLQAATDRHQNQIRVAQDRILELRKSREDLTEAAKTDRRPDAAAAPKP